MKGERQFLRPFSESACKSSCGCMDASEDAEFQNEEKLNGIENVKSMENQSIEDKGSHAIAPSKAITWTASHKSQRRMATSVSASQAVGIPEFVPIPKPPLPTLNSTPVQRTKFMMDMQAYMNQLACFAYGGPPAKAPPAIDPHNAFAIGDSSSSRSRLVFRGSDAQIQTSYENTLFPIGFAVLKKFNESFQDVETAYVQADAEESIFDDSSMMPRSPSSIANLIRNYEVSVPGPSRGDRGSLMICCVCRVVYPEDHRVACRWCGKTPLWLYRCAGLHVRYYCRNHPGRR